MEKDDKRYDDVNDDSNDDFLVVVIFARKEEEEEEEPQKTRLITRSKKDDRPGRICPSLTLSSKWKDFELTHIYNARARVSSPPPGPWLRERRHHRRRGQALSRNDRYDRLRETSSDEGDGQPQKSSKGGSSCDGRPRRSARGRRLRKLSATSGRFRTCTET